MPFKLFIISLLPLSVSSQLLKSPEVGFNAGICLQFGTHVNGIGIQFNTYFTDRFYQFNLGEQFNFQLSDLANRRKFFQSRFSAGTVILTGKKSNQMDFQLNGLFHNTRYNYGLAYNYLFYNDNIGTKQRSGGWGLHLKKIAILFENDFFGGQGKDRFRTGNISVSYRDSTFKFTTGFSIWTGETTGTEWQKIKFQDCPNGFRILEDKPYGKTSHGIIYLGFEYGYGNYQWLSYKIGVDSEHFRHILQNRFMHDLNLLPNKIPRRTPHYPMLDKYGCPVFDKTNVRKSNPYFQGGINSNWSY